MPDVGVVHVIEPGLPPAHMQSTPGSQRAPVSVLVPVPSSFGELEHASVPTNPTSVHHRIIVIAVSRQGGH